jgi:hypothetical protein
MRHPAVSRCWPAECTQFGAFSYLRLQVLQSASERVFVPLTVGGGIRGFTAGGQTYPALQVASEYFR